jgi:hypothetical protein
MKKSLLLTGLAICSLAYAVEPDNKYNHYPNPEYGNHQQEPNRALNKVRRAHKSLLYLLQNNDIKFRNQEIFQKFNKSLRNLDKAIEILREDQNNDHYDPIPPYPPVAENVRGDAAAIITELASPFSRHECLETLPRRVFKEDLDAIKAIMENVHAPAEALRAYFERHSSQPIPDNHRGQAAAMLTEKFHSFDNAARAIRILPKFVNRSDLRAIESIVERATVFTVHSSLESYFKR